MENTNKLNFGQALEALKTGRRVSRAGWNGKGMYLWELAATTVPLDWIKEPRLKAIAEANGGKVECLASIRMLTADGKVLTGWLASQSDMFAQDWEILDPVGESKPDEMVGVPCQVIGDLRSSAMDLCYQIEKSGASPELTKASEMASGLQRRLNDLLP